MKTGRYWRWRESLHCSSQLIPWRSGPGARLSFEKSCQFHGWPCPQPEAGCGRIFSRLSTCLFWRAAEGCNLGGEKKIHFP
jgi:hypothetical protein